jgi:hypothetical protein
MQPDSHEMPAHLKVLSDRGMYDRARRGLRGWAIRVARYLAGKQGAKQATVKEIGRDVFEGGARRQVVQSILTDYLGLSKEGRETRTLVEIYPEYFIVQPAPSGGEGAFVTLRADAPHIGEDEEEASMAAIRKAVADPEAEELAARRPVDEDDGAGLFGDDPPAAASSSDPAAEALRLRRSRDAASREAEREATAIFRRVFGTGARADGASNRRGRPR